MNDSQLMHAMSLDDTYRVEQVLARGEDGITELVTIDGAGPFVRKKMRQELARRNVWSTLTECSSPRLPRVEAADTGNESSTDSSADSPEDTPAASSSDFRALMDGYEQFMNSYVEFMKKYEDSDDTTSMLADYGSMMQQYSDWSKKFDDVDESSLSADDQAYYLEVQGRVAQKQSEIQ